MFAIVELFFIAAVLMAVHYDVNCLDGYDRYTRKFHGKNRSLTEVPMGIPAEVWHIFLQDNKISTIPSGTFGNLTKCYRLNLDNNLLTDLDLECLMGLSLCQISNLRETP